jgi:putative acetyltransferase
MRADRSAIQIRCAEEYDLNEIAVLFYETITTIATKDYGEEHIKLWSTRDMVFWKRRFHEQHFILAEIENRIAGFASLTVTGYIDFLYVHKDHQRKGIAGKLLMALEDYARSENMNEIFSDISITAKEFFLKNNFVLAVERKRKNNNDFKSFAMRKPLYKN